MSKVVMALGSFFVLASIVVLLAPDLIVSVVDWESRSGQNLAGTMRIGIGVILVFSAPETRYPKGMRVFGGLIAVVGVGLLFIPSVEWASLIRWWLVENLPVYRFGGAAVGVLLGGFLVHAARPARPTL